MLKQILSATKVVLLALVLSFGLSYALAWTAPTATPPGANVAAPLNASATDQVKAGGITAGSLTTTGLTTTGTLRVTGGAPGLSKVLTSDASGNATWQAAASGLPVGAVNQTLRFDGTAWTGSSVLQNDGTNLSIPAGSNLSHYLAHGNNTRLQLPAANNGAGTGAANLVTWISEPAVTWTGAGIARNRSNSGAGFPRINTNLSSQMIRFDEGTGIIFSSQSAAGTNYTPLTLSGNNATVGGTIYATGYGGLGGAFLTPRYVTVNEDSYGAWPGVQQYRYCNGYYNHDTCDGDADYAYTCPASRQTSPTCVDAKSFNPADQGWCGRYFQDRIVTCNANQYFSVY